MAHGGARKFSYADDLSELNEYRFVVCEIFIKGLLFGVLLLVSKFDEGHMFVVLDVSVRRDCMKTMASVSRVNLTVLFVWSIVSIESSASLFRFNLNSLLALFFLSLAFRLSPLNTTWF